MRIALLQINPTAGDIGGNSALILPNNLVSQSPSSLTFETWFRTTSSGVILGSQDQTFGTALDRPASVLQGRLIRLGLQAKF